MIITIKGFDFEIIANYTTPSILVVENATLFRKLISNLLVLPNEAEREIMIKENQSYLASKKVKIFTDYFSLSLNEKTSLTKLYISLEEKLKQEYDSKLAIEALINKVRKLLVDEMMDVEPSIIIQNEISFLDIFKLFGITFEENKILIKEMLFKYLDICFELKLFDLYIFANLSKYFDGNEIRELYQYLRYHEMNFFCIEYKIYDKIAEEKVYLIDEHFLEDCY